MLSDRKAPKRGLGVVWPDPGKPSRAIGIDIHQLRLFHQVFVTPFDDARNLKVQLLVSQWCSTCPAAETLW